MLWSCLTDAVSRHFLWSGLSKARYAVSFARPIPRFASVVKNGPGDRYKQDPFKTTSFFYRCLTVCFFILRINLKFPLACCISYGRGNRLHLNSNLVMRGFIMLISPGVGAASYDFQH